MKNEAIKSLVEQVKQFQRVKIPTWKPLLHIERFCGKDPKLKFMKRSQTLYEKSLDIRSFVQVRSSLSQLLALLLNEQQLTLFKYQRKRALSFTKSKSKDEHNSSSSSDDFALNLGKKSKLGKAKRSLMALQDFKVKSQLDKKLLSGMFVNFKLKRPHTLVRHDSILF